MNNVHQHPDGMIYVRVGDKTYRDTKQNFEIDFGIELPPLPDGAIERIYDQGRRHVLQSDDSVIGGDDMPWKLGDQIIADVNSALAKKRDRDAGLLVKQQSMTVESMSGLRAEALARRREEIQRIVREELAKPA